MSILAIFFGPVSSAKHGGDASRFTWIAIGFAIMVLVKVWSKYLNRDPMAPPPEIQNLLWISAVCLAMIVLSVYQLLLPKGE